MRREEAASRTEDAFLIANWEKHTIRELARMLGWQDKSVRDRGRKLGLAGRREIALAITRKLEADRIARRKAVKPLPVPPAKPTAQGWSDGWSIKPPTMDQLRSGGRPVIR